MQNRYRILTTAIALAAFALAFAAVGASGTSDADPIYNGSCGDGVDFSFDKGTLNIEYSGTGTGMMYNYKSKPGVEESPPWDQYKEKITTLKIGNGVTSIGDSALEGCENLEGELAIPDTVTYIGSHAFQFCAGLTGKLAIPDKVTYIGSHAFEGCKKLTGDLKIPNSVEIIRNYAFQDCPGFDGKLTLPDNAKFDTIDDYTFKGCKKLTGDLVIPNTVVVIGNSAFQGCENLTGDLVIPSTVLHIYPSAFQGCSNIESLDFKGGLKQIPKFAFSGCNSLKDVIIPSDVELIDGQAFGDIEFYDYIDDGWKVVAPKGAVTRTVNDATNELSGKTWKGLGDKKLYHSFEITFDAETNGGKFSDDSGKKVFWTVIAGELDSFPGDPSKAEHDFKGWYLDEIQEDHEVSEKTTYNGYTTVYAHYAKWNLTVTFLPGEGTGKMDNQIIYYDSQDKTLSQCGYSKEGSIFAGWQDKSGKTYGQCDDLSGYRFSSSDDTLVLTAQWVAKKEYDITGTITNGGLHEKPEKAVVKQPLELIIVPDEDYVNPDVKAVTVTVGDRILEVGKDYICDQKAMAEGGKEVVVTVVSIHWGVIDGNVTVTAECLKNRIGIDVHLDEGIKGFTYTVGGVTSDLFTKSTPFDVEIGSDVTLEVVLKEGFLFVKWDDDHRSGKVTFENVREYIELYPATKSENVVYEITFDANGGTPAETKVKTDKYGKLASIPEVTRDGYTFVKWEEVETGNEVTASYIFEWDTIVEAVWEMNSPNPGPGPNPGPNPDPTPTPKPKPPVITVNINFKPTTGGKISTDSMKIPLNAKVTVNGDTLIIGSGSSRTIVKAEAFNGFVFDSWSIEDGNILKDGEVTAKFRAITLAGISVESSPVKTEYKEGEKFDPAGLIIIAGFDDMSSMTMGYDGNKGLFTFSPSLDAPLSSDDTTVTVYYNGQSTDIAITVTSDSGDDTVMYAAIGVAVAVALAAVAAFFLIRKP